MKWLVVISLYNTLLSRRRHFSIQRRLIPNIFILIRTIVEIVNHSLQTSAIRIISAIGYYSDLVILLAGFRSQMLDFDGVNVDINCHQLEIWQFQDNLVPLPAANCYHLHRLFKYYS